MELSLKEQIIQRLDQLDENQLLQVLNCTYTVNHELPPGIPGREIVRRLSSVEWDQEAIAEMIEAIEEAFPILCKDVSDPL